MEELHLVLCFTPFLNAGVLLDIAITCRALFRELSPLINKTFVFRYCVDWSYQWYKPQRLKVGGKHGRATEEKNNNNIISLFQNLIHGKERPTIHNDKIILPPKHTKFNWNLPSTLTHLTFGPAFNLPIDGKLPPSLTHLSFENNYKYTLNWKQEMGFTRPIDHLPSSLTHLVLGDSFNLPVNNLPTSLSHISFGFYFHQSIDKLPSSITHITFENYNRPINKLPLSLVSLKALSIEKPIHYLPPTLTYLGLYHGSLTGDLPSNLLSYHCRAINLSSLKLPDTIIDLEVYDCELFPPNLQRLSLDGASAKIVTNPLPPQLKALKLMRAIFFPQHYPVTLLEISIVFSTSATFEQIQSIFALPNLARMALRFNEPLRGKLTPLSLPPKLVEISFEDGTIADKPQHHPFAEFVKVIDFTTAPLRILRICNNQFSRLISESFQLSTTFPPNLSALSLTKVTFSSPLPRTLQQLEINLANPFTLPPLPNSLTSLKCTNCQLPASNPSFPPNLTTLTWKAYVEPLPPLPSSIRTLDLQVPRVKVNEKPPILLPRSLRSLDAPPIPFDSSTIVPPFIECVHIGHSTELPPLPLTIEKITMSAKY